MIYITKFCRFESRMKIFNVRIDEYTKLQFVKSLKDCLRNDRLAKVSKINPEFIQRCRNDNKFKEVINSMDINIADGRGVLWAAKYLILPISNIKVIRYFQAIIQMVYSGLFIVFNPKYITNPIPTAIPGIEAFKAMMKVALDEKVGVFLFGSSEDILKTAIKNLNKEFPKLKIAGHLNGYDFQKDKDIDPVVEINKTDAKILIVALGSPKQEHWIDENISKLKNIKIAVGEGGTLDRIANPSQKAPNFINQIGLEWLWRLFMNKSKTETRNRFQRFWTAVPMFIVQVVKWKMKYGQTQI